MGLFKKYIKSLLVVSLSIPGMAEHAQVRNSKIGLAAKTTAQFQDKLEYILKRLEPKTAANPEEEWANNKKLFIKQRMLDKCDDQDSVDRIEWIQSSEQGQITVRYHFICFVGDDPKSGSVFSFRISEGADYFHYNEIAVSDIHIEDTQIVAHAPKNNAPQFVVVIETVAFTAGVLVSTATAREALGNEQDLKQHAGYLAGVASLITSFSYHVGKLKLRDSALLGAVTSCAIGATKEVVDPYMGGHRSKKDLKADIIGCAMGSITYVLIQTAEKI